MAAVMQEVTAIIDICQKDDSEELVCLESTLLRLNIMLTTLGSRTYTNTPELLSLTYQKPA